MSDFITTRMTIINELGLHARAATVWVQLASTFDSELIVRKDGREINGKSIMGVLLLTATQGSVIEVKAQGPDAADMLDALAALVADKFGEEK